MVSLTPFEERVLDVIGELVEGEDSFAPWTNPNSIHFAGSQVHGDDWAGTSVVLRAGFAYPVLNAALGRLRQKGMLERHDTGAAAQWDEHWGEWHLTDLGRDVLGMPAV